MEQIKELMQTVLNRDLISMIISNPREKGGITKIKIRPILKQDHLVFQEEAFSGKQVFHKNREVLETVDVVCGHMEQFKQAQIVTSTKEYTVLISKKGKATIKSKSSGCKKQADLSHNRKKKYILEEGTAIPFLQDLGVMTSDGKIAHAGYDKYKQINRFLEFIADVADRLPKDREVTILDFGCGKSYLTFAIYYYFHELLKMDVRIIGLDLKEDVISHCNGLAQKYGYEKLKFLTGDIADYTGQDQVDMVVTLHACDTATDFALKKAVDWQAKVILSVPCCQHELNRQMKNDTLEPIFKYGLIKERMAALVTDALRADYLEREGYDAQILEFIDMEHTPKNILIRAVKTSQSGINQNENKQNENKQNGTNQNGTDANGMKQKNAKQQKLDEQIKACEELLHVSGTFGRLLDGSEK